MIDILHVDIAFLCLYAVLFIMSIWEASKFIKWSILKSKKLAINQFCRHRGLTFAHLLHATYKMYLSSLALQFMSLVMLVAYFSVYARDGFSLEGLKLTGKAFEALSTLIFLLLLILLAKGYTVTRARLKRKTAMKITLFMATYTIAYAILFSWEQIVSRI